MEEANALGLSKPVHQDYEPGIWKLGRQKDTLIPVQNRPIAVIYPPEAHLGLWGGEGIVKGFVQRRPGGTRYISISVNVGAVIMLSDEVYKNVISDVHFLTRNIVRLKIFCALVIVSRAKVQENIKYEKLSLHLANSNCCNMHVSR